MTDSEAAGFEDAVRFVSENAKPGAAFAFRAPSLTSGTYRVCFRQECVPVTTRWSLLATDPEISGNQYLLIEDTRHRWTLKALKLDTNIFEAANRRIVQLRLPANVIDRLQAQAENIESDIASNRKYYTHWSDRTWDSTWRVPLKSPTTSDFGSIRIPPGGLPYAHSGVDLRARPNTPVRAASAGVVLGTDTQVLSGNVIVIDHGKGVMSRYLHLSKFKVKPGDEVKSGQVIGLSGATGRVEAPHLHWEIRIRGRPVDPRSTIRLLAHLAGPA